MGRSSVFTILADFLFFPQFSIHSHDAVWHNLNRSSITIVTCPCILIIYVLQTSNVRCQQHPSFRGGHINICFQSLLFLRSNYVTKTNPAKYLTSDHYWCQIMVKFQNGRQIILFFLQILRQFRHLRNNPRSEPQSDNITFNWYLNHYYSALVGGFLSDYFRNACLIQM